tara:strand:+ start:1670 stop:2170 length:501 start_codon:yes stop_codon:yes gene_type:complete
MSFKVVDDFLDINDFNQIKKIILGDDFSWYYNDNITNKEDSGDKLYFTHSFFRDLDTGNNPGISSNHFYLLKGIIKKIKCKSILRIKANLYLSRNKKQTNQPHVDYPFVHKGCILYINDNNGCTYFGKESVKPKANRIVFFDPSKEHASSLCTDEKRRVNINFNYF